MPKKKAGKAKPPTAEEILVMRRAEFRALEASADFDALPKAVQRAMVRKALWLDILDETKRAASVRWP